jgi:hypothetical protein
MMEATKPINKAPKSAPITVPRTTIQTASMNFALSFTLHLQYTLLRMKRELELDFLRSSADSFHEIRSRLIFSVETIN